MQVVNFTENLKNGFEFFSKIFLMKFMRISKLKFSPYISLMGTTSLDWAYAYDAIEYERIGKVRIFFRKQNTCDMYYIGALLPIPDLGSDEDVISWN